MNAKVIESNTEPKAPSNDYNMLRPTVRGIYDIQSLRLKSGQRITASFYDKLNKSQAEQNLTPEEIEKQREAIMASVKKDYARLTDALAEGRGSFPSQKKFTPTGVIETYTELVMVNSYMKLLEDEEAQFRKLGEVLKAFPMWTEFLEKIDGIGPAMAGILLSEIDITKARYPSSLWKYSGLDVVTVAVYTDEKGEEQVVSPMDHSFEVVTTDGIAQFIMDGKYPVEFRGKGRNRGKECLVDREYLDENKETKVRKSLSYNPTLKTKVMGVLAGSFLKTGRRVFVDGTRMGIEKRRMILLSEGEKVPAGTSGEIIDEALTRRGYTLTSETSKYAQVYYDYRDRLRNDPNRSKLTPAHIHWMALRYMVKRFLVDYYVVARTLSSLPVAPEYIEAKYGIVHGEVGESKTVEQYRKIMADIQMRGIVKAVAHSMSEETALGALLNSARFKGVF